MVFFRLATSETARATPEDQGPMMYFAPSASMASSARRVALPALVSSSRVMYLMARPWIFIPRSSRAIFMPRSRTGPTSAKAPVKDQRPSMTSSFDWASRTAGNPSPAAAAAPESFNRSRRVSSLMGRPSACSGFTPVLPLNRLGRESGEGGRVSSVLCGASVVLSGHAAPRTALPPGLPRRLHRHFPLRVDRPDAAPYPRPGRDARARAGLGRGGRRHRAPRPRVVEPRARGLRQPDEHGGLRAPGGVRRLGVDLVRRGRGQVRGVAARLRSLAPHGRRGRPHHVGHLRLGRLVADRAVDLLGAAPRGERPDAPAHLREGPTAEHAALRHLRALPRPRSLARLPLPQGP